MATDGLIKSRGCSGCLIEAIELRDEWTIRRLLSARDVEFHDTFWAPSSDITVFMEPFPDFSRCFPVLSVPSSFELAPRYSLPKRCTHSMDEQSLLPESGQQSHIAMSVMLVAMLHTTHELNAFLILVESQNFDMSEPLIFHWRNILYMYYVYTRQSDIYRSYCCVDSRNGESARQGLER